MKNAITLFMLTLSLGLFAQEFSGKATYQTKRIFKDIKSNSDDKESAMNDELMKQLEEALKKSSEKTFFLEFTKDESLYTEEEVLQQAPKQGAITISYSSSTSGDLYKNLKEGYSLLATDYLGKDFLVKDSLHTSGWELSSESKQIGNYTAYKATKAYKAKTYFSEDEDKKENSEEKSDEKTTDLLSMIDKKEEKELVYTAWYTPEIPIPNGPETFGGLPGLILELHTPNEIYLCSEIVLNPKKPIKVKAPKGKITSQQEYDEMIRKRLESMPKTKDGKGRIMSVETIQIGG